MSHQVITVTPSGRRQYLEILTAYLLKNRKYIDKHHFWVNTTNEEDIAWMLEITNKHPDFFKMIYSTVPINGNYSIHPFFRDYTEPNTVYIRFDDDICWIAPDAIPKLIEFRLKHPEPFIVFANTINNAICSHIHQRFAALPWHIGLLNYDAVCKLGWGSGLVAEEIHKSFFRHFRASKLDLYKFRLWVLWEYARMSINCISWLGNDFAQFGGEVEADEELWLSVIKPMQLRRPNIICGDALVSHFAFHTQRPYLEESTELLAAYKGIVN